jgi:hypothetical protein
MGTTPADEEPAARPHPPAAAADPDSDSSLDDAAYGIDHAELQHLREQLGTRYVSGAAARAVG